MGMHVCVLVLMSVAYMQSRVAASSGFDRPKFVFELLVFIL